MRFASAELRPTRTCWAALVAIAALLPTRAEETALIAGLDHIPVAVGNLEQACATYRALGFVIKPGRHHDNGILNAHVKFPDGSGIELITAKAPVDPLTRRYVEFLAHGDGPAFLALRAPDSGRLAAALRRGGYAFTNAGGVINVLEPALESIFFVRGNRSPTDRPEHFAHPNGASALRAVWIAAEEGAKLERVLVELGGASARRSVLAPDLAEARVVSFEAGDVVVLPASRSERLSRPIMGASIRVASLDATGRELSRNGVAGRLEPGRPRRLVLPPRETCGLWLEFRESP